MRIAEEVGVADATLVDVPVMIDGVAELALDVDCVRDPVRVVIPVP